jgi:glycosidase
MLTEAAHRAKPGSTVIGEVWNYPAGWFPALDGVINFYARRVVIDMIQHKISAGSANRMLAHMVSDCGIEPLLKSWFVLDNHDTDRLKSILPDDKSRRLAQVLQFTLPGCPVIYYGSEVGMEGAGDPGSRGAMRWDLVSPRNEDLKWYKKLIAIRKSHPALRIGDYTALDTDRLLGFARRTDKALETVVVLVNPSDETVSETVSARDGRLMNGGRLKDLLGGPESVAYGGLFEVTVPPRTARVYKLVSSKGYTPYKRVP